MKHRIVIVAFSLVLLSALSWPQSGKANWDNLKQIRAGQRIQVVETNLRSTRGKFVRVTDSEIIFEDDGGERTVPREKLFRVSEDHQRGRKALNGAVGGAVVGVLVGAVGSTQFDKGSDKAAIVVLSSGVWAGMLAGVSALATRNPTVYRMDKPEVAPSVPDSRTPETKSVQRSPGE